MKEILLIILMLVSGSDDISIKDLIQADKWWEAFSLAEKEEKKGPTDPSLICAIGDANYKVGEFIHAFDLYKKAHELGFKEADLKMSKTLLLFAKKQRSQAREILIKSEKEFDKDPAYWLLRGGSAEDNKSALLYYERYMKYNLNNEDKLNDDIASHIKILKTAGDSELFKMTGPDEFSIPFENMAGVPVISAVINDSVPARLIFDTGANAFYLNKHVYDRLKLRKISENTAGTASKDILAVMSLLDTVRIGSGVVRSSICATGPENLFSSVIEESKNIPKNDNVRSEMSKIQEINGALPAFRVFKDYKIKIDYANNSIVFFKDNSRLKDMNSIDAVIQDDLFYVPVSLDGLKFKPFLLDTGSNSINVDKEYLAANNIKPSGSQKIISSDAAGSKADEAEYFTVKNIGFLGFNLKLDNALELNIGKADQTGHPNSFISFGIIGNRILNIINPIYDYENAKIYLER